MTGVLRLRPLTVRDLPALQELLDADPGYALRVTGEAPGPDAATDVTAWIRSAHQPNPARSPAQPPRRTR